MMESWKQQAEQLYFDEHKTWSEIVEALKGCFPGKSFSYIRDTAIRSYIRNTDRYKELHMADESLPPNSKMNPDGSIMHDKLITIYEGQDMTPEYMMKAHGLDPYKWKIVTYCNNNWHSQIKGGKRLLMCQSKITVKPHDGISLSDMDDYFANKKFEYDKPLTEPLNYDPAGEILEIDLPDLHSGLLAWKNETGEDYDVHIALKHFYQCFYDIVARCKGKKIKRILFATLGDLLHTDNDNQTTTKGTFQQSDGRLTKIFNATLDMLIDSITILGGIAPVEVIYLPGNHDRTTGCFLIKAVEMAFRKDSNITFDTKPDPQKFKLCGNVLLGFTHGDMPSKNMVSWLQQSAREEYGLSKFAEIHSGHWHSEKTQEVKKDTTQTIDDGGVVIRYLPTICNASYWEHQQGYNSAVKAMMAFIWNETTGLREAWYSNIA